MQGLRACALLLLGRAAAGRRALGSARLIEELPPREGAWKYNGTRQIALEEIGRCYDPEMAVEAEPAPWEAALRAAASAARGLNDMPHALALTRPINHLRKKVGIVVARTMLPQHRAVALTSERVREVPEKQRLPDSHCFLFDYDAFREGDPDPHGCGFFRKSFRPMQKLRQCIVGKLEQDPVWSAYDKVAGRVFAARPENGREVQNPLLLDEEERAAEAEVVVAYDSIRRADEIVKSVSFKEWEAMPADEAAKLIEAKILKTVTLKKGREALKQETVQAIRQDCFHVGETLPKEALVLKRALPCYQLMWDQIEVAAAPEQPMTNAVTMWDRSLVAKGTVEKDFNSPPVCARAAAALVAEKQKRAPQGYASTACVLKRPSWRDCLAPQAFNCICFQFCWRKAMERLCEIQPACCDRKEA